MGLEKEREYANLPENAVVPWVKFKHCILFCSYIPLSNARKRVALATAVTNSVLEPTSSTYTEKKVMMMDVDV